MSTSDELYQYDSVKVEELKRSVPWMNDSRYFKRVKISPSAIVKMMAHSQSGVDKGIKRGGKPIEVMGLLLGRPDVNDPRSIIIVDAQAIPCEGFETSVVAQDDSVVNHMIELGEMNELTRNEVFCGWYHTHPFDLDANSHCYLSTTDISTQIQWQRAEDPFGNPYLAIVIDPLRSIAKGRPEIMAFRTYPPEYAHPVANETPDGTIEPNDKIRISKWGICWNRYYSLNISYFMSDLSTNTLNILKNKFSWMNSLSDSTSIVDEDAQPEILDHLNSVHSTLTSIHNNFSHNHSLSHYKNNSTNLLGTSSNATSDSIALNHIILGRQSSSSANSRNAITDLLDESTSTSSNKQNAVPSLQFHKANKELTEVTTDQCRGCLSHMTKILLFLEQNKYQKKMKLSSNSNNAVEEVKGSN